MKTKVLVVFRVLPDELLLEILARIPMKSICKFKSVCKLWYKLLSENYFSILYNQISMRKRNPMVIIEILDTSGSKPRLFCVDGFVGVSEINLDFIKDRVQIGGSYDGLLWCYSIPNKRDGLLWRSSIPNKPVHYVCNPMTRQYKVLPPISQKTHIRPFYPDDGEGRLMGTVSDVIFPLRSEVAKYAFECLVYDSETSKWTNYRTLRDDGLFRFSGHLVYMNGLLYRLNEGFVDIRVIDIKSGRKSLSINVSKIKLPVEVTNVTGDRAYLLEFDGLLSVVQVADAMLTIWVLKDTSKHEHTWEVVEKLRSRRIRAMAPHIYRIFQSGAYMIFATHKKVVIYNRSTNVWTDLFTAKDRCFFWLRCMTRSFSSLLSRCD